MAESASTGSVRRGFLKAAALLPAVLLTRRAHGTDYPSAAEALAAIDALAAEVDERLRRLETEVASARGFAASLRQDLRRHLAERAEVRRRLGLGGGAQRGESGLGDALDLEALRAAMSKLAYAHAESLPVLGDPFAVRVLARHMVDASRHLALVGLWIEAEERRG